MALTKVGAIFESALKCIESVTAAEVILFFWLDYQIRADFQIDVSSASRERYQNDFITAVGAGRLLADNFACVLSVLMEQAIMKDYLFIHPKSNSHFLHSSE